MCASREHLDKQIRDLAGFTPSKGAALRKGWVANTSRITGVLPVLAFILVSTRDRVDH
jgi:hypothetical protein